jgi:hypothetical protein
MMRAINPRCSDWVHLLLKLAPPMWCTNKRQQPSQLGLYMSERAAALLAVQSVRGENGRQNAPKQTLTPDPFHQLYAA